MRAHTSAVFALVAFTLGTLPARAQDATIVEVTPYVAVGSAAASPVGTAVTFPVTSTLSAETDVAYRRGEGDIHALEFKRQSVVFPSAHRPIDTVCRRGRWAIAIRGARFFLQRSSDRHRVARGPDRECWRRPEDACEREAGFANRCPVVQVFWPSGIGAVSGGSRPLLRCRQTVARRSKLLHSGDVDSEMLSQLSPARRGDGQRTAIQLLRQPALA